MGDRFRVWGVGLQNLGIRVWVWRVLGLGFRASELGFQCRVNLGSSIGLAAASGRPAVMAWSYSSTCKYLSPTRRRHVVIYERGKVGGRRRGQRGDRYEKGVGEGGYLPVMSLVARYRKPSRTLSAVRTPGRPGGLGKDLVSTMPGEMEFTRIPSARSSSASVVVSPSRANLDVQYGSMPAVGPRLSPCARRARE